jgi:hypothetical protein
MNDTGESPPQESSGARWLLLVHQLPPKPDYLRVKVRRRLHRIGAVPIKHTVYLLPDTDEALEDFQWLRTEIESEGGSVVICRVTFIDGLTDEEIQAMLDEVGAEHEPSDPGATDVRPRAATWVTRQGVHVDRIASAWLIRRFVDPDARFRFVPARGYRSRSGEIRFDMYEAEYTHEGADCTFQTLVRRFGLRDAALTAIAEIVHDIDCKDERFGRPETSGVASLVRGIVSLHAGDPERLERGGALFDDLYASLGRRRRPRGAGRHPQVERP